MNDKKFVVIFYYKKKEKTVYKTSDVFTHAAAQEDPRWTNQSWGGSSVGDWVEPPTH
jgi:hypothetical protein